MSVATWRLISFYLPFLLSDFFADESAIWISVRFQEKLWNFSLISGLAQGFVLRQ
jgi:hypothetical protein